MHLICSIPLYLFNIGWDILIYIESLFRKDRGRWFPILVIYRTKISVSGMKSMGSSKDHYSLWNNDEPISLSCYGRSIIMEKDRIQVDDRSIPIDPTNTSFYIRKGILCSIPFPSGPKDMENDSKWIPLMMLKRPISLYERCPIKYGDISISYG